jgi:hypothetical protein
MEGLMVSDDCRGADDSWKICKGWKKLDDFEVSEESNQTTEGTQTGAQEFAASFKEPAASKFGA